MNRDITDAAVFPRAAALGIGRRHSPVGGRIAYLVREFGEYLRGSTLDVGAGSAAAILQPILGSAYHALDIGDSYKLSHDAQREALRYVADIEKERIPLSDHSFDTVICLDVLEHVDDPHRLYVELFRLARERVIVSLPNNWPTFMWSLLAGRNVTHRAGYGLSAKPKRPGERHKYFFNLEEAHDFLTQQVPDGFRVARVDCVFEHGTDGILASFPPLSNAFRLAGKASVADVRERFGPLGVLLWAASKLAWMPARLLDIVITAALAGWGERIRFYNLFCRQLWVMYERVPLAGNPDASSSALAGAAPLASKVR